VPLVHARIRVEDDDSSVSVPIRNEHFIGRRVDRHVRGLAEIRRVIASGSTPATSDLQEEFAVTVKLEDLVFGRPARASPRDPDVVPMIDKNPVFIVGVAIRLAVRDHPSSVAVDPTDRAA
jgi:hypothetical protein